MIQAKVTIEGDLLKEIRETATNAPKTLAVAMRSVSNQVSEYALKVVQTYPEGVPTLPFIWSYDPAKQNRARRWYFANKAKGNIGGRYQRTGGLGKAWETKAVITPLAGEIELINTSPAATYVYGPLQVPSHYLTGWQPLGDSEKQVTEFAENLLIEAWVSVLEIGNTGV